MGAFATNIDGLLAEAGRTWRARAVTLLAQAKAALEAAADVRGRAAEYEGHAPREMSAAYPGRSPQSAFSGPLNPEPTVPDRGPGAELARPYEDAAAKAQEEAEWLLSRANAAAEGFLLCDMTRPPAVAESELYGVAAKAGRIIPRPLDRPERGVNRLGMLQSYPPARTGR